ncbi:unnamed protein product [Caenorhabditis brenneri]
MVFRPKKTVIGGLVFLTSVLLCYITWPEWTNSEYSNPNLEFLYRIPYPIIEKSENPLNISADSIAIVMVLAEGAKWNDYKVSIDSVECYAKAHGYQFVLTKDNNWGCDHLLDKFFRRHCVIAKILPRYEAVLHLDADIGVVNPKRKLEDFLDEKYDITFYDRHFDQEVAAGSYFVRNTTYAVNLLTDFANYETRLPVGSVHGTDNGAIHIFLAEKLFPQSTIEIESCRRAWENSRTLIDQFAYTSCIRNIIGEGTVFGKIRILKKGTGHIRDGWLTNGMWSPERDFMLHGWKMNHLDPVPHGPLFPAPKNFDVWYNPFLGDFHMDKCVMGNTTWLYNEKLITSKEAIEYELRKYEVKVSMKKIELLSGLFDQIKNTIFRAQEFCQEFSATWHEVIEAMSNDENERKARIVEICQKRTLGARILLETANVKENLEIASLYLFIFYRNPTELSRTESMNKSHMGMML